MNDGNAYRGYDLYSVNGKFAMHLIHRWADDAIKVVTKKSWKILLPTIRAERTSTRLATALFGLKLGLRRRPRALSPSREVSL